MRLPALAVFTANEVDVDFIKDRQLLLRDLFALDDTRCADYTLYEQYYDGEQGVLLMDRPRLYLERHGVHFCENITEVVIDAQADRMHIEGVQVEDSEKMSDWFKSLWERTGLNEKESIVHTETPKLGDGFMILEWDEKSGMPIGRWNSPKMMKVKYEDNGEDLRYAIKRWATDSTGYSNPSGRDIIRANIYLADRIERWFCVGSDGQNWEPWFDDGGTEQWPEAWTTDKELPVDGTEADDDTALGVPVFHFKNKPKGSTYGRSEVRGVMSYQDEINKQVLDLFLVMDTQGWQWPWASGVSSEEELKIAVGDVIKLANTDAKMGQLTAANPVPMLEAILATHRRLSAKSRTPLHELIEGSVPTGESLKTAETGLVLKCDDRKVTLGDPWADYAGMSWRLADVFGDEKPPESYDNTKMIKILWAPSESRNKQADTNTFAVQVEILGLSKTTALRELGYDPNEEQELREEEAAEEPPEVAPPPPTELVVTEPKAPSKETVEK